MSLVDYSFSGAAVSSANFLIRSIRTILDPILKINPPVAIPIINEHAFLLDFTLVRERLISQDDGPSTMAFTREYALAYMICNVDRTVSVYPASSTITVYDLASLNKPAQFQINGKTYILDANKHC